MNVQFLASARADLSGAVDYYNQQREGLGLEFSAEVQATLERILEHPRAWPLVSRRTRRCRTKRFPYGIIYHIRGKTLLIIAVMHLHREPESWKTRLSGLH